MKHRVLIATTLATTCFFAGVLIAQYLRPNTEVTKVTRSPQINSPDLIGTPAPSFSLHDTSGKLRHASEWKDRILVINFWATWCPPCLKEIPHFVELQQKYKSQGLQFVGITLENINDIDTILAFSEQLNINYPLLIGGNEVIALANKLGNRTGTLPYTVIIDKNGAINFVKNGPLSIIAAEQAITSLL